MIYHPKICECGTTYTPTSGTQKRCPSCGAKLAKERNRYRTRKNRKFYHIDKEKRRERDKRYRLKHADAIRERNRLYNRIHRKIKKLAVADPAAAFRLKAMTGRLQECPRLHVRATSLPCGRRPECFGKIRCDKCPAGAAPPSGLDNPWAVNVVGW